MKPLWIGVLAALPLMAVKLADLPGRDPFILADADSKTYYLYTTAGPDVQAYKSKDLVNWEGPRAVFAVVNQEASAPEVHLYRGKYYLLVTLHDKDAIIDKPPASWRVTTREATWVFVAESAEGPFQPLGAKPPAPEDFMTIDGTLYVEGDLPYLVYAHDWTQRIDGAMEAVQLKTDLSAALGEPFYLFKGSDAAWLKEQTKAAKDPRYYPVGGPFLYRTRTGSLLMLWSNQAGPVAVARSVTGKLRGPWRQPDGVLLDHAGQAMIFSAFNGRPMLAAASAGHVWLLELEDAGETVRLKR